jgi:hypothetical protein
MRKDGVKRVKAHIEGHEQKCAFYVDLPFFLRGRGRQRKKLGGEKNLGSCDDVYTQTLYIHKCIT